MKTPCALSAYVRDCLAVAVLLTLCLPARAQVAAPGTIEGRVLNARTGEYLESAHLTVPGTTLETFTDAAGSYRLTMVPAGTVQLTVFYTGLPSQTTQVAVAAGRTAQQDISLGVAGAKPTGDIVKLAEFRVETSREMEASALAINEQRFSSSIKNILSTEVPSGESFQEEIEFGSHDRGMNKASGKKDKPSLKKDLEEIKNVLENIKSYLT